MIIVGLVVIILKKLKKTKAIFKKVIKINVKFINEGKSNLLL